MNKDLPTRFFGGGDDGIAYDTSDQIAVWLKQRPHLIDIFVEKHLSVAIGMWGWGDLVGIRYELNFLVDVLESFDALEVIQPVADEDPDRAGLIYYTFEDELADLDVIPDDE